MQHSKVICCNGELDNFRGVLHLRDFYKALNTEKKPNIESLIREPLIFPERVDAARILTELRRNENKVCFVVNEYGGLEGIITLYDILENLVGEIPEEGENPDPDMYGRDDDSVLVNGDAPVEILDDILEDYEVDLSEIDYATVAGFVLSKINKIPRVGDKFVFLKHTFEVVDMDGNRVDKILVKKN